MTIIKTMISHNTSLRRSLHYSGVSRKRWYYTNKPREIPTSNHTSHTKGGICKTHLRHQENDINPIKKTR